LEFLSPPKQLRKAREVLDTFAPAAEELSMPAIGTELQTLAFATLIRNQPSLDTAFRLLDAPEAKRALRAAPGPLILVTSARLGPGPGARRLRVQVGDEYRVGYLFFLT
jgi:hypothetical protein